MQMKSSTTKIVHTIFLSLFIVGLFQVNPKPVLAESQGDMYRDQYQRYQKQQVDTAIRASTEQYERYQKEKRDKETANFIINSLIFVGGSLYFCYWAYKNSKKPK